MNNYEPKKYYLDGVHKPPYYLRDTHDKALIFVSRDEETQMYADSMGIEKGKDGLTEIFQYMLTSIEEDHYVYNTYKIKLDTSRYDFVISLRQKRYSCQFDVAKVLQGAYDLKVVKMNNPSSIPDYIEFLHGNLQRLTDEDRKEEIKIVRKIEKLLSKYVKSN